MGCRLSFIQNTKKSLVMPPRKIFFYLLILQLFAISAFAETTYKYVIYVDPSHPNAANRGEGFASAPFKTLKAAIRWAIDLWDAEENVKVVVAPGVYHEAVFLSRHKVPNQLLFVASSNTVTLDGTGVSNYERNLANSHSLFNLTETENVTFKNFVFTHSETDSAVECLKSKTIVFENCRFVSNSKGLRIEDSRQISLQGCELSQNEVGLVVTGSKSVSLENSSPTNNKNNLSADAKSEIKTK
jgi:parallel beta-helix repeat protein